MQGLRLVYRHCILLAAGVVLMCIPVHSQNLDYKGFPEWSWQKQGITEFMLYTPADTIPGEPCPLVVFLHGCCGEDEVATLRNAVDPPVRMWHGFGQNIQTEPTYIMAPKTTRGWTQKFPDIKRYIDSLIGLGKVDPQRIYMTGFSMGGAGTWQFMERYPGYLAAAIPMGMGARADLESVRDIPVWAIRGEEDWHARNLPGQVDSMRRLNGYRGGAAEWVTGVNPRYTSFEGVGHGVQWDAASSLPLTRWAYEKINDGNSYPVVYFISPVHRTLYPEADSVTLELYASDPDGSISAVEIRLDSVPVMNLGRPPYRMRLMLHSGDQWLEALAYDRQGKQSTASIMLQVDIAPGITTVSLPEAYAGTYYEYRVTGRGNDPLEFTLEPGSALPPGIRMDGHGKIYGIPEKPGTFHMKVLLQDAGYGAASRSFDLMVREKDPGVVVVSDIRYPHDSLRAMATLLRKGTLPNLGAGTEVSVSEPGRYEGLTCIVTDQKAAGLDQEELLGFTVDEDVILYVAYEARDRLYQSTVPAWLNGYRKEEDPQIVAQYHYFDVYSKPFPAGRIELPGAAAGAHNVSRNYFLMVEKDSSRSGPL
jgi:dienelactone hydrolase